MANIIVYAGGMEFPDKNAAAQRVIVNSKILEELGFKVVLVGIDKTDYSKDNIIETHSRVYGYDCYNIPYPSSLLQWIRYITSIRALYPIFDNYNQDDIFAVIAYNYPAVSLRKLISHTQKRNIKLIADCTEWYGKRDGNFIVGLIKELDTVYRMKFLHKKVKNIICISDFLEKYYLKKGCNTINVPPLLDRYDKKWVVKDVLYKPNLVRTLVYVGNPGLTAEKDRLDFIIDALYQLKMEKYNFKFKIAGISKNALIDVYPIYKNKIDSMEKNIDFLGIVPHQQAVELIKRADFTIFARTENKVTTAGFPIKLSESFACGTPVITNPTSNISKFIVCGKNGFIAKDCTTSALKDIIKVALRLTKEDLIKMHEYCLHNNQFDYRLYIELFKSFINN